MRPEPFGKVRTAPSKGMERSATSSSFAPQPSPWPPP